MARPTKIGKEHWATYPRTADCRSQDGSCENHSTGRPLRPKTGRSLAERCPEVAARLDAESTGWGPEAVSSRSSTALAVWRCPSERHTFCATPFDVMKAHDFGRSGCGICSGKVVSHETSLAATAPWLADQWHDDANQLTAKEVSPNSNTIYWWKCPAAPDHIWGASPNNRYGKGSGCPFCSPSGQRASSTNNVTLVPALMRMWDPQRNNQEGLYPQDLSIGSKREAWWKCPKGLHDSERRPVWKQSQRPRCRKCAGHEVSHTNSLMAHAPQLASELDVVATGRTADEVSYGENGPVHWRCAEFPDTHRWTASPLNRITGGNGCPDCMTPGMSAQEVRLAFELAEMMSFDPKRHRVAIPGKYVNVDMVVPRLQLLMEFDGSYWHRNTQERDSVKTQMLRAQGWTVVRIREHPLDLLDPTFDVVVPKLAPPQRVALVVLGHLSQIADSEGRPLVEPSVPAQYELLGSPIAAEEAERYLRSRRARAALPKS
jgi:hypothetical protein